MAAPVPRDAATVVIVRDAPLPRSGIEVLLLRRAEGPDHNSGAWVFPGGVLDPGDRTPCEVAPGLTDLQASERLGLDSGGLAFYLAAIRECFEEAGSALADPHGPGQALRHPVFPRRFTRRASGRPRFDRNAGPCMDCAGRCPVALEHPTPDGTDPGDPADAVWLEQLCRGQALGRAPARRHLRPASACADLKGPRECAPQPSSL